ncbi:MAG TPA: tetratricopeptide repeat protein, partial [Pseudolabrys sp.]
MTIVNGALNKDPDNMEMLMLGSCIVSRDHCWGMSYNLLKRVAEKSPPYPEIYNNLGMAASSLASSSGKDKYLDEAEACLRKALHKDTSVQASANLALVLLHQGKVQAAEKTARDALGIDPSNVSAHETLGYACLHQGNWIEGFGNYEFTLGGKYRKLPKGKYWERGERGKRLLVRGEQGIGDEITYASVIPDAAKHHAITYECDARLEGLMRRSLPGVEVVGTRFDETKHQNGEDFGAACLTGSLCMEYRRKDEDFPRRGFLVPDPERKLQWRTLLDTLPGKKIGIAWTGGLDNTFKHRRS